MQFGITVTQMVAWSELLLISENNFSTFFPVACFCNIDDVPIIFETHAANSGRQIITHSTSSGSLLFVFNASIRLTKYLGVTIGR